MKITESILINNFLKKLTFNHKNSLNLEDDIYYDPTRRMIFSTDTYEEGIHFFKYANPKNFIKKIFKASISDIYCKGFKPFSYFLSLSINKTNLSWFKNFKTELTKESKKHKMFLGGGDTIKSKKLSISISVLGYSNKKPILRSGAKIHNDVYITGNLGDSYLGLLIKKKKLNAGKYKKYFIQRFENPSLPIRFSSFLNKFATSSIDISDGLIKDMKSICSSSRCGVNLNYSDLPLSKNLKNFLKKDQDQFKNIFSRGDDYGILFTANKKHRKFINLTAKRTKTKVTRVGKIVAGKLVKLINGDKIINHSRVKSGYIHYF